MRPGLPLYPHFLTVPILLDFTGFPLGSYAGAIPGGFTYGTLGTTGNILSVRTGLHTISAFLDATLPRISLNWVTGGGASGIVMEPGSTNFAPAARDITNAAWNQAGSGETIVSTGALTGPDGTAGGNVVAVTSGGFCRGISSTLGPTVRQCMQLWIRSDTAGAKNYQSAITYSAGVPAARVASGSTDATWIFNPIFQLADNTLSSTAFKRMVDGRDWSSVGGLTAQALQYGIDFMQVETLAFPTTWISTTGVTKTRNTNSLNHTQGFGFVDRGRISAEFIYSPHYQSDLNTGANINFVSVGNATIAMTNTAPLGRIVITIGSSVFTTTGVLAAVPGDQVKVFVEAGGAYLNTVVKAQINGGAVVTLGTSVSPQIDVRGIGPSVSLSLFNSHNAILQQAGFYPFNQRPAWAA